MEFFQHWNQQATSCPSPQCLMDISSAANSSCCQWSDTWSHIHIINTYSNISDNIIIKVTNVYQKKCSAKNGALRNSSINWIFLWRHPIQSHSKPFTIEKWRNKAKCLSWNSIRLKFMKQTSIPNPVKSPSNSIRYNCQKICSWSRRPKTISEIRKKTFL